MKPLAQTVHEGDKKAPTRRALAKQHTRAKILDAARKAFSEQGYEGATIRDIAAVAGMSTGAVFANFTDKSDLFREIMVADMETLVEKMREGTERGRTVDEAILNLFAAGYEFYGRQLPLARAAFSVSWAPEDGPMLRSAPIVQSFVDVIATRLNQGVERGELSPDAEPQLRARILFDCYLANFPQAVFGGWSLDALQSRSRDQIRIVLAGARRG